MCEGDIRPEWFIALEAAILEAEQDGWTLTTDVVFSGQPYEFRGEIRIATWTREKL